MRSPIALLAAAVGALLVLAPAAPLEAAVSARQEAQAQQLPAFPGALGWASTTPGGRGGEILRVTNLNSSGPGSFRAALEHDGARIIVFEVGGVIDLERESLRIRNPYLTIAGQTAPSPGITLIRGGIDIATHDVIIQHIRIRSGNAGEAPRSGWDADSISTIGARNVIIDHCTLTWATDENLSASGPRFTGETPDDWRRGTSHNITFSNNIIANGLAHASHAKGEHSKGSLIHDNVSNILIVNNLYAHNFERNPLFKGGVRGVIANNLIYNPGARAIHYNLMVEEWGAVAPIPGQMTAIGNVMRAGPSTLSDQIAFLMIGGAGDLEYYGRDNIAVDQRGNPLPMLGRYTTTPARIIEMRRPPVWWDGLEPIPAVQLQSALLRTVGARPWDRDIQDVWLIAEVAEGRGAIIDNESEVGGYPAQGEPTRRAFNPDEWDMRFMTPLDDSVLDRPGRRLTT